MTVQIPIGLLSEVDKIIEQKSLGFRSRNEFCVDCVRRIVRIYQSKDSNNNCQPLSGEERTIQGGNEHGQMAEGTSTQPNTSGLDDTQRKPHRATEKRVEDKERKVGSIGGGDDITS